MMRTEWMSGGILVFEETAWDGAETDAEQAARHAVDVAAKLVNFPIDRPPEDGSTGGDDDGTTADPVAPEGEE